MVDSTNGIFVALWHSVFTLVMSVCFGYILLLWLRQFALVTSVRFFSYVSCAVVSGDIFDGILLEMRLRGSAAQILKAFLTFEVAFFDPFFVSFKPSCSINNSYTKTLQQQWVVEVKVDRSIALARLNMIDIKLQVFCNV